MSQIKIEKLTPEQESKLNFYRDKWIESGLSTEPANRKEAERGIIEIYKNVGLAAPKIVWCGSPLSQGMTRAIILDKKLIKDLGASVGDSVRDSVGDSVRDSVRASVGDSVWASVRDSVRDSVGDSVRDSVWASVGDSVRDSVWASVGDSVWDSVWDSVRDSVGDSVWDSVWDSVRDSVGDSVRDSVRDSVGDSVWASGYGQHDANWLAFYEFFFEQCGLQKETEKLAGHWLQAKNAGWYLPHKNICWVSERHSVLMRDEQGRLHSLNSPAIMYPDGWAIYAVHGVRVPEYIIERPHEITPQKIDAENNAEIRRVMIDRYGVEKYLIDSDAKEISKDAIGILYKKELPDDEPIIMVRVKNSTPEPDGSHKDYFIRVPPEILSAREAVAWSFGMKAEEYNPVIET